MKYVIEKASEDASPDEIAYYCTRLARKAMRVGIVVNPFLSYKSKLSLQRSYNNDEINNEREGRRRKRTKGGIGPSGTIGDALF